MNKKTKKGFTLVELLVVIAILAILATVSVVGYTSFIAKANLSNDQSTIGMINRNLEAASINNAPDSAGEAITLLYGVGFNSEKLRPYSAGFHYVYNKAENKFYLADKNHQIIYPEESTDYDSMWAIYRNESTDLVGNIKNYIAVDSIATGDKAAFDAVFTSGAYTLDLNSNYIGIAPKTGVTVTAINGVIATGAGVSAGDGVEQKEVVTAENVGSKIVGNTLEDVVVEQGKADAAVNSYTGETLIFKNVTFVGNTNDPTIAIIPNANTTKIIVENCTFINSGKWALELRLERGVVYEIKNNSFINCTRGININHYGVTDDKIVAGSIISGNTFNLANSRKANALQFAGIETENLPDSGVIVTIENNKFESCYAVAIVHEGMVQQSGQTINALSAADCAKLASFSGNTFGSVECATLATEDAPDTSYTSDVQAKSDVIVGWLNSNIK